MRNRPDRRISELGVALLLGAISFQLMSCGRSSAGAAEPTAPEAEVVAIEQRAIPVYREWIGTLDGMVNAAIRAQVTGYVRRVARASVLSDGRRIRYGSMEASQWGVDLCSVI